MLLSGGSRAAACGGVVEGLIVIGLVLVLETTHYPKQRGIHLGLLTFDSHGMATSQRKQAKNENGRNVFLTVGIGLSRWNWKFRMGSLYSIPLYYLPYYICTKLIISDILYVSWLILLRVRWK